MSELEGVEAKVKVPRQVLEYLKGLHSFGKIDRSFEEFLGDQLTNTVRIEIDNFTNDSLLRKDNLIKSYGLDKVDC